MAASAISRNQAPGTITDPQGHETVTREIEESPVCTVACAEIVDMRDDKAPLKVGGLRPHRRFLKGTGARHRIVRLRTRRPAIASRSRAGTPTKRIGVFLRQEGGHGMLVRGRPLRHGVPS